MKLEIDVEVLDGLVLAALKKQLSYFKNPKPIFSEDRHPDDIKNDKKLRKALKCLIAYYGG